MMANTLSDKDRKAKAEAVFSKLTKNVKIWNQYDNLWMIIAFIRI
jgi:hypothetical protein